MTSKIIRRIILLSILVIFGLTAILYKTGSVGAVFNNYTQDKAKEDIRNREADTDIVSNSTVDYDVEANKANSEGAVDDESRLLEGQSIVGLVQSARTSYKDITAADIDEMVAEAVELAGGFDKLIKDGQTVVLKPNLVQMHIDSTGKLFDKELNGVTTDWRVTKAVAKLVRKYNPNGKIYIMEGSAGDKTRKTMEYLRYTPESIPEADEFIAIEDDSGDWKDFDSSGLIKYDLPNGLLHKEYYLNRKYAEADVLISIPCMKSNSGAVVTGGIKNVSIGATPANIYGVAPGNLSRTKMVSHKILDGDLDKWIYDYYMCKPVDFVIIDGLVGFQNGPVPISNKNAETDKMNMRLIMAGSDAIAVDTVEALVEGWDPLSITYLAYLNISMAGNIDTTKITVKGSFVDEIRRNFDNKLPKLGGVRIAENKGPDFEIVDWSIYHNKIEINTKTQESTSKIEVYVNDKLYMSIPAPDLKNIIIDISGLESQKYTVKLIAYDRFLNHTSKTIK